MSTAAERDASRGDVLDLARDLRTLSATEVHALLQARQLTPKHPLEDDVDLAEALLAPEALDAVLARLDGPLLAALDTETADAADRARLLTLGLLLHSGSAPAAVRAAVDAAAERSARPRGEWGSLHTVSTAAESEPESLTAVTAAGAERALRTVHEVDDLIEELLRLPARLTAGGALAVSEAKRLSTRLDLLPEDRDRLIAIAERAGILAPSDGRLHALGDGWWELGMIERWTRLLGAVSARLLRVLPENARPADAVALRRDAHLLRPLAGEALDAELDAVLDEARLLGLVAEGLLTRLGSALLRGDTPGAELSALLPPEIEQIYVQNDHTAIAPGFLRPELERRLRSVTERESRDRAASYRFTTASIGRALDRGETVAELLDFLRTISLTGVPQSLEYALRSAGEQHGTIVVERDEPGGALSRVRTRTAALLEQILADTRVQALGLRRVSETIAASAAQTDTVLAALRDARYPAIAPESTAPHAPSLPAAPTADPHAITAARIVDARAHAADAEQAWVTKRLQRAVKDRRTVLVTMSMPDGSTREVELEPRSVVSGRLRARDRQADTERTVPLSVIVSIE